MLAADNNILMSSKNKRFDPNYNKITADVEKEVSAKVRAICALTETSFSEAVNEALKLWIEMKKKDEKFEI
jgi:hypothetical protein